jgi:predicted phage tail component-like protein
MMGFIFKGKHTREFQGLVVKTVNNPLLPSKRINRVNVMGYDGEYIFENGYNNKLLEFKCMMAKGTIKERRIRARDIALWLSGTGDLVFDYENDKTYRVVKTVSDVSLTIEQVVDEFSIIFEVEPFQYGQLQTLSVDNPTSIVITNNGNEEADTFISVTGIGDVTITCGTQSFTLLDTSEKINLDSNRMLVYTEALVNVVSNHSGDFIKLSPGSNELNVSGVVSNLTVKFYDTYI